MNSNSSDTLAANVRRRQRLSVVGGGVIAFGIMALSAASAHAQDKGFVYTETNATSNGIMVFNRAADGTLSLNATVATGGVGGGVVSVGSQGTLAVTPNGRWLFAANEGDNTISVMEQTPSGLRAVEKVSSNGTLPVSITFNRGLLYVLNDGANGKPANISGYFFDGKRGALYSIPNSSRYLSAPFPTVPAAGPIAAEIGFDNSGSLLYVTEVGSSLIDKYSIGYDGIASQDEIEPSFGSSPFAFAFGPRDHLLVSEIHESTQPSDALQGAVTSYKVNRGGYLNAISGSVPDNQTAPCWLAITGDGRYAYTVNTASSVISGYQISYSGAISLLGDGVTAKTSPHPLDIAFTRNSRYLYNVSGSGTLVGYRVKADGSLIPLKQVSAIPTTSRGLVAE